jgi:ubiquinone biosynthesis monooxygenase Coq6
MRRSHSSSAIVRRMLQSVGKRIVSARLLSNQAVTAPERTDSNHYDVVISGAGAVGAAFLSRLCKNTAGALRVAIVDVRPPPSVNSCQSTIPATRVYAMSPASIKLLREVGAWDSVDSRSQSYTSMQIWDSEGPGFLRFSSSDVFEPELGRIIEDNTLQVQQVIFKSMRVDKYMVFLFLWYLGRTP